MRTYVCSELSSWTPEGNRFFARVLDRSRSLRARNCSWGQTPCKMSTQSPVIPGHRVRDNFLQYLRMCVSEHPEVSRRVYLSRGSNRRCSRQLSLMKLFPVSFNVSRVWDAGPSHNAFTILSLALLARNLCFRIWIFRELWYYPAQERFNVWIFFHNEATWNNASSLTRVKRLWRNS